MSRQVLLSIHRRGSASVADSTVDTDPAYAMETLDFLLVDPAVEQVTITFRETP